MANIIGTNGNDSLLGGNSADTIKGLAGNDTITGNGGKDIFVYNLGDGTDTITDFGGIGKGTSPTAGIIAEVDTIKFLGAGLNARNLLLTQNANNLEITFEGVADTKVILKNFKLENLENLKAFGTTPAIGNILFDGQTSITDNFNVLNANSTDTNLGIKNTVTFLNDLDNDITGLDDSDDVINGQGGNDKIDGKSGNDLLRGGVGNDTLIGGAGNDTLIGGTGNDSLVGGIGNDWLQSDAGNDTLIGGIGNDNLNVDFSLDDSLLDGGNGNDTLSVCGYLEGDRVSDYDRRSSGNNTLNGGAGDDNLSAKGSVGNNLLSGGDGNDTLSVSGEYQTYYDEYQGRFLGFHSDRSFGNNTLNGGAGNDNLSANNSIGNNLLSGGDGNDTLEAFGLLSDYTLNGNDTLNGGAGNDNLSTRGSTGSNLLSGGDGNDILTGGYGNDTLYGNNGTDTFAFNSFNEGVDTIYDFNATTELIQVSAAGFGGGLSIGSLAASQLKLGTSATTSNQRFIYDNITGALFFDQDGSASGFTQVKFAQLSTGLSLTKNNFVVVV
nr:calcium-binding protein [Nostoc sp. DedQUE03]MDZ7971851.1 calcium-binding protein [Nostoc sp. DedQUE03]MDZ8048966.1 calcium-binding protein [Nostoc sp. DedQUE02]